MNSQPESPELKAISSLLCREICRPLDTLQASLNQLLAHPERLPTPSERDHATTMLGLCDDLRRLTEECLGSGAPMLHFAQTDPVDAARGPS